MGGVFHPGRVHHRARGAALLSTSRACFHAFQALSKFMHSCEGTQCTYNSPFAYARFHSSVVLSMRINDVRAASTRVRVRLTHIRILPFEFTPRGGRRHALLALSPFLLFHFLSLSLNLGPWLHIAPVSLWTMGDKVSDHNPASDPLSQIRGCRPQRPSPSSSPHSRSASSTCHSPNREYRRLQYRYT